MPIDFRKPQYFKEFRFGINLIWNTIKKSLNTFTGEIVRFFSEESEPIIKLEANFTPIQSLNGQEAPWPPGGGKNKLETTLATETSRGITATVNADGSIVLSGTNDGTSYSSFKVNTGFQTENGVEYILSGGFSSNIFLRDVAASKNDTGSGVTITGDGNAHEIDIRILANTAITGTVVIKPMIRLASDPDGTWQPCSNICPISGHTGCEVVGTGKNLLATLEAANAVKYNGWGLEAADITGGISVTGMASGSGHCVGFLMGKVGKLAGQSVTLSCTMTSVGGSPRALLLLCDNALGNRTNLAYFDSTGSATATIPQGSEDRYIAVSLFSTTGSDSTSIVSSYTDIQLELGSTASAYEAYRGTTVAISFGSTVYGGKLTVNEDGSGQVVADSELEVFNIVENNVLLSQLNNFSTTGSGVSTIGDYTRITFAVRSDVDQSKYNRLSNTYAYTMCNMAKHIFSYNNESTHWYRNTVLYVFLPTSLVGSTAQSVFDYLTSIKDTTPLSLWIPLATPITIPLTAQQIQTLVGTNTVWVNDATGDITVQAYGTEIT